MIKHKPRRQTGEKGWYYCNPPDDNGSEKCGSCVFVTDFNQIPKDYPWVPGVLGQDERPNCPDGLNNCGDTIDCSPITSGIY